MAERLSVPQQREQASGVRVDEDGDKIPSVNAESSDERAAAIDAALSGEAVSVHDSSDIEGDE